MTRQELEKQLSQEAEECRSDGFHWGAQAEAGEGVVRLILVRLSHREPYSVYTPVEMPGEGEWLGLTELWEIESRSVYQVVVAEYVRRTLRSGEDPRDYPKAEDYRRCESCTVSTSGEVKEILGKSGKSLADVGPLVMAHIPCCRDGLIGVEPQVASLILGQV